MTGRLLAVRFLLVAVCLAQALGGSAGGDPPVRRFLQPYGMSGVVVDRTDRLLIVENRNINPWATMATHVPPAMIRGELPTDLPLQHRAGDVKVGDHIEASSRMYTDRTQELTFVLIRRRYGGTIPPAAIEPGKPAPGRAYHDRMQAHQNFILHGTPYPEWMMEGLDEKGLRNEIKEQIRAEAERTKLVWRLTPQKFLAVRFGL